MVDSRYNEPKNIILSSDGTGNAGGHKYDSNVWRLHTALEKQSHKEHLDRIKQIAYYHDGVGTDDNKILRMIGGAIGIGLGRIIIDLYIFLVNNYEPGDRIYLFGFSRGSYTVRLLAGMITEFGILKKELYANEPDQTLRENVKNLLSKYKKLQKTKKNKPQAEITSVLDSAHKESDKIQFLGVWDTVDAYGIPSDLLARFVDKLCNTSFRYHDRTLSKKVLKARHALALDDQRRVFSPVLWDEVRSEDHKRIHQVWFAGAHSNVGGGYPKQGMAWTSLEWMMQEVKPSDNEEAGLFFDWDDLRQFSENKDVHDRLYDSRSGLLAYYAYKIRNVCALVNEASSIRENTVKKEQENNTQLCEVKPRIHISVFDRIMQRTQEYSPSNIPHKFEIVGGNKDELAVFKFAKTYRSAASQSLKDAEKLDKGLLAFIRKYSAYIMFWSQAAILAFFGLYIWYYCFTWPALFITAAAFIGVWIFVWRCVRKVQDREKRYYSRFWRRLISKL